MGKKYCLIALKDTFKINIPEQEELKRKKIGKPTLNIKWELFYQVQCVYYFECNVVTMIKILQTNIKCLKELKVENKFIHFKLLKINEENYSKINKFTRTYLACSFSSVQKSTILYCGASVL